MRKLRITLAVWLATAAPQLVLGQSLESTSRAMSIGKLIASEGYCEMDFDQEAIAAWIKQNADPADLGFSQYMDMSIGAEQFEQEGRSASGKTAHCAAMRQNAEHYGLIVSLG